MLQQRQLTDIAEKSEVCLTSDLANLTVGVQATLESRESDNTWAALRRRFELFKTWAQDQGLSWLPASAFTIALYGEHLDNEGKALATIQAYISAIGSVHVENGVPNPCADSGVKEFMAGKRRQHAGMRQSQARALSESEYQAVLVALGRRRRSRGGRLEAEEYAAKRALVDHALLVTMTQAALRRSEAAELRWADVAKESDGTGRIEIPKSKTDQMGRGAVVAVKEDCMTALYALQSKEVHREEQVFGLSPSQISRRLKTMCAAGGIDPERVSGHTPRVTLARLMSEKGAPTHIIQRQGRWETPGMVMLYTREARAGEVLRWL